MNSKELRLGKIYLSKFDGHVHIYKVLSINGPRHDVQLFFLKSDHYAKHNGTENSYWNDGALIENTIELSTEIAKVLFT